VVANVAALSAKVNVFVATTCPSVATVAVVDAPASCWSALVCFFVASVNPKKFFVISLTSLYKFFRGVGGGITHGDENGRLHGQGRGNPKYNNCKIIYNNSIIL
jgi:hypothetical protein